MKKLYIQKAVLYYLSLALFLVVVSYTLRWWGYKEVDSVFDSILRVLLLIVTAFLIYKNNIHYIILAKYREYYLPILAIVALGLYGVYGAFTKGELDIQNGEHVAHFVISILAGFFEESFFRVLIFALVFGAFVKKTTLNQCKAILFTSMAFSVMHIVNYLNQRIDIYSCINQMIFAFYIGVLLQSLYIRFGSVILVSFIHGFINFFSGYKSVLSDVSSAVEEYSLSEYIVNSLFNILIYAVIVLPISYLMIRREKDFSFSVKE